MANDDEIQMTMRAQIGGVSARDAMAKLDEEVDKLTTLAAADPKKGFTVDSKEKGEAMRGWAESLGRKWSRFIRAN